MRCFFLLASVAILWLNGCDNVNSSYPTLDDARGEGLFDGEWLPDILPFSSYDIRITTDVDLNRVQGEFSFDPIDFPSFAAQFGSFYQPFEYSGGSHTWVFFCDPVVGHCYFWTR